MKTSSDRGSMNPVHFAFWTTILVLIILAMVMQSCSEPTRESSLFKVTVEYSGIYTSNATTTTYVYAIDKADVERRVSDTPHQFYDVDYTLLNVQIEEVDPINQPFEYEPAKIVR